MKLTRQSVLAGATLVIGGLLGASALVAMAQVPGWNPPSQTPPNGNVAAPINVGVSGINNVQEKLDSLMIDGNFGLLGNFVYRPSGVAPTPGQVLVAQASSTNPSVSDGTVKWGNGGGSGGSFYFINPKTITLNGSYTPTQYYDASGILPVGTKAVILQAIESKSNGGYVQLTIGSNTLLNARGTMASTNQGVFYVGSDMKIPWSINCPIFVSTTCSPDSGFNDNLILSIVGYIK